MQEEEVAALKLETDSVGAPAMLVVVLSTSFLCHSAKYERASRCGVAELCLPRDWCVESPE